MTAETSHQGRPAAMPWQVGVAGAALTLLSVHCAISGMELLLPIGDRLGIAEGLPDYQARGGAYADATVVSIIQYLGFAAQILWLLAAIFAILAVALWRGVLRSGVRVTASAFSWIFLLVAIRALFVDQPGNDASTAHDMISALVALAAAIGCALLWFGSASRWARC